METDSPLLIASGVSRRHPRGEGWLLRAVSISIRAGERIAVTGPAGSGKTLLLRALAVLDPLDAGEILWRGQRPTGRLVPAYRRQVVYVHQRPALLEGTVEFNLRLPYQMKLHRHERYDRERIERWLGRLGRDAAFLAKTPRELSGGESQIAALLRVLQLDPLVLLLDEPTAALDREAARAAESLITAWLGEDPQRATVWVSHDPAQTERMADRRIEMAAGQIFRPPVRNGIT